MKKINIIVFIVLNIIFIPPVFGLLGVRILGDMIFDDTNYILLFLLFLILIPLKFSVFPIFYRITNKNNAIFPFLEKMKNKNFAVKVLFWALITDILSIIIPFMFFFIKEFFSFEHFGQIFLIIFIVYYISSLGGLFTNYLSFLLWYKLTHKNKTEIIKNQEV